MGKREKKKTDAEFQVKGLTKRWLMDIVGVVLFIIVIAQFFASFFIYNYYFSVVNQDLSSRINLCSNFMSDYSNASDAEFEQAAKDFIDDYDDKKAVEIQFINSNGKIFISSLGYIGGDEYAPDYINSFSADDSIGDYKGKNSNGESVVAKTSLMPKVNGKRVGAIRFITSTKTISRNILINIALVILIGLVIIAITITSGLLFLRSILNPIRAITQTSFRIASGKFDDRLPVNDADEIGKLCDTINYMASELESTEKLKNDFISSVSHELRTPLTVIQGWGETVKSSIGVDDELVTKGINVINNEIGRLSGLVEDLLDFSRMQSGRLQLKKEKVDILAELGEAVYMYESVAKKRGIGLTYLEPKSLPAVMADPDRLKQVFINIIDNAIKYSGNSGHVMVEATQSDVYIQVTVSDMGCGIAAEDLAKVKEKFYKANHTVRGSGIGLAMADEIVKQHNGVLLVDSKENVGTTVSIALPYIQKNATPIAPIAPTPVVVNEANDNVQEEMVIIDKKESLWQKIKTKWTQIVDKRRVTKQLNLTKQINTTNKPDLPKSDDVQTLNVQSRSNSESENKDE